jgi:HAD superfamily hydrolase (TIGR01484 family)
MVICSEIATLNTVVAEIHRQRLFDNVIFAASNSIDILPEGVNKGNGLKLLSKIKDIPLERIAVVGDWLNDLSMFQVGGFSVAMGNAPDELKAQADLVAPTMMKAGPPGR